MDEDRRSGIIGGHMALRALATDGHAQSGRESLVAAAHANASVHVYVRIRCGK